MRSCSGKVKRLKKGRKDFELLSKNMRVVLVLAFLAQAFVAGAQTNMGRTGTASASSQQSGNGAANAIDNNTGTRWSANTANANEWLKVDLGANYSLCSTQVMWQNTAVYKYKIEISTDNATWTLVVDQQKNSSSKKTFSDAFATFIGRYVRITATGLPSGSWASIYEFRTFAVDLAINKTTLSSSTQSPNMPSNAVDGDTSSRWAASDGTLPQWLMVDLGSISTLNSTNIIWEKTGVYKYKVEISNDNASWTQVVNQTGNSASKHVFTDNFSQKTGRYVRITATGLPSGYWASIREFSVLGPFPDPAKWYRLVFLHSNMVLKNLYMSPLIMQSGFSNDLFQEWQLLPASTQGYYKIQNSSMSVLDNTNGTIDAKASTGGANQQFKLLPSPAINSYYQGYYYIVEKQSGKAVEVSGSSHSDGATLGENSINITKPVDANNSGCANQLVKLEDATPWSQTEFEIGTWIGPLFTKKDLQDCKNANFNSIMGVDICLANEGDGCFTNTTINNNYATPLTATTLPPFYFNYNVSPFTDYYLGVVPSPSVAPIPMDSCLKLLKAVGGLKMLIMNGIYNQCNINDPYSIYYDYDCFHDTLKPIALDNQCIQDEINNTTVYKNFSKYRDQMLGYYVADEPVRPNTYGYDEIGRASLIKDNLAATDPGMLGYVNFMAFWGGNTSWDEYANYIDGYIANPNTKVVTFDYYVIATVWDPTTGLIRNPPGYCQGPNVVNGYDLTYFLHLNLFATSIQNHGNNVKFWGNFGCSCEQDLRLDPYWRIINPIPTDLTLRYYASTSLIYGSKGMIWYTYLALPPDIPIAIQNTIPPNNPSTPVYSLIQKINGELKTMGPVLLGLDWIKTVHGASIDPCSQENNLVTGDMSDNIIAMVGEMVPYPGPTAPADQMLDYMAVGEFQPHAGDQSVKYVLIMNKWLQFIPPSTYPNAGTYSGKSTDFYYTAIGTNKKIYQFNKSTGAWKQLSTSVYRGTTFDLVVAPGDVQLIKITN